ncbi:hypothetical protein Rsub_11570 [Raphidocelis subcapitata]|uniref:F-box domain-containing protein n=1 Tax=Raphidocelis subcapitata TaxID=307507 RepID=A0A2V0PGL2_9CHLO|nr:hypothetical protein Rsub_11570 [Raphidocelis subcapitata]|eukprot:GBF98984.1 hypothetical protein Rsub_11570 [Raphidocelis subcapitata]
MDPQTPPRAVAEGEEHGAGAGLADLPWPAMARFLDRESVSSLMLTCRTIRAGIDADEAVWRVLAARRWPHEALRCCGAPGDPYPSVKALVLDGNRECAERALDLTGLTSAYRYKLPSYWFECRLLRLLWRRKGGEASLRLLFDARGEWDLREPIIRRGASSSLAVLELAPAARASDAPSEARTRADALASELAALEAAAGEEWGLMSPEARARVEGERARLMLSAAAARGEADSLARAAAGAAAGVEAPQEQQQPEQQQEQQPPPAAAAADGQAGMGAPWLLMGRRPSPQPPLLRGARRPRGAAPLAADCFEPAVDPPSRGGRFCGALVWGEAKARAIIRQLEGRDGEDEETAATPGAGGGGGGGGSSGGGGGGGGGGDGGGAEPRGARVLVFCYSNRLGELGSTPGAEEWADYTLVPLLTVPPGASAAAAWAASARSAALGDALGAAEAALASEAPEAARARWADVAPAMLARGWMV